MAWEKRGEAEEFKFEKKGESLTGELINMKKTRFDSNVYTLLTADGNTYYFFGCHTLDTNLPAMMGKYIRITYKGKVRLKNKQTLHQFDIEVWKPEEGKPPPGFESDVPF